LASEVADQHGQRLRPRPLGEHCGTVACPRVASPDRIAELALLKRVKNSSFGGCTTEFGRTIALWAGSDYESAPDRRAWSGRRDWRRAVRRGSPTSALISAARVPSRCKTGRVRRRPRRRVSNRVSTGSRRPLPSPGSRPRTAPDGGSTARRHSDLVTVGQLSLVSGGSRFRKALSSAVAVPLTFLSQGR
jgi:hypothetical protein